MTGLPKGSQRHRLNLVSMNVNCELRKNVGQTAVQKVTKRSLKKSPPGTKKHPWVSTTTTKNGMGSLGFATFAETKVERELTITSPWSETASLDPQRAAYLL